MIGRCISQNELAQRWQISEATLERWRSQRKGPQYLKLGGQVRYRLADVEAYELEKMEVVADTQTPQKASFHHCRQRESVRENQPPSV